MAQDSGEQSWNFASSRKSKPSIPVVDLGSDLELASSSSHVHKKEDRISFVVETHVDEVDSKLTPFNLKWSYGYNKNIPSLNLTTLNRTVVFYASSHAGVLYDYDKKDMQLLLGHHNAVSSIASDSSGKWIVTADSGNDNVVIVWDSDLRLPTRTMFNPHIEGTRVVGMSPNAKYLITISDNPEPIVAFWLWTLGEEEPNATLTLDMEFGKVNHIAFHPDFSEYFILTSHNKIAFLEWENDQQTLRSFVPDYASGKSGRFIESTYLPQMKHALTCTTKGIVEIWESVSDVGILNKSISLCKEVRLQRDGITSIQCINNTDARNEEFRNIIVTGNPQGHIRFYDHQLRILYWCQRFDLEGIVGVSFPKFDTTFEKQSSYKQETNTFKNAFKSYLQRKYEDRSEENELSYKQMIPSDASLERRPFVVQNFIVSTSNAQIGLVNFLENQYKSIMQFSDAPVTAIDTHGELPYLAVGNVNGQISIHNHENKKSLINCTLPPNKMGTQIAVQSLKYTPSGLYLLSGMADGTLWVLNPSTLVQITAFHNTLGAITKICITENSKYITHMDTNMCVSLYIYDIEQNPSWEYFGKQRAHYKPIRDILFGEHDDIIEGIPQLFSLGEDRMLVEYDIKNSRPDDFKILSAVRLEQSAIPYCMSWYPMFKTEKFLLFANSEFKYKIVSPITTMCRKTTLSPIFGSPVLHMKMLQKPQTTPENKSYMIVATEQQIGIQLLPIDGNPFKSVGMIGHPDKILQMCFNPNNKIMYTIGHSDSAVLMWDINERAVDVMAGIGGEGISPFCGLIEGGMTGWLFEEMQDIFYYAQILNQGDSMATTRQVSDKVPLCVLPDLMRAVGYYPTDYEIENMLCEVNFKHSEERKEKDDSIRFEDFVCLYVNHHPAYGIYAEKLKEAFTTFADSLDGDNSIFTRDRFLHVLQDRGEKFSKEESLRYMNILLKPDYKEVRPSVGHFQTGKEKEDKPHMQSDDQFIDAYNRIPREFTYRTFADKILGIIYDIPPKKTPDEELNSRPT